MKKLCLLISIILISFSSLSCSNESNVEEKNKMVDQVKNESEFQKLQLNIQSLNKDEGVSEVAETRSIWHFFHIILADVVGGMFGNLYGGPVGAIAGAVATSATEGVCLRSNNIVDERPFEGKNEPISSSDRLKVLDVVPNYDLKTKATFSDSIGYYHNKILLEIEKENVNKNNLDSLIVLKGNQELGSLCDTISINNISKNENITKFMDNVTNLDSSINCDEYCDKLCTLYPNNKGEISIIKEFIKGIQFLNDNDKDYTSKVINMINNTKLDDNTKINLKNAVIVGTASNRLWSINK